MPSAWSEVCFWLSLRFLHQKEHKSHLFKKKNTNNLSIHQPTSLSPPTCCRLIPKFFISSSFLFTSQHAALHLLDFSCRATDRDPQRPLHLHSHFPTALRRDSGFIRCLIYSTHCSYTSTSGRLPSSARPQPLLAASDELRSRSQHFYTLPEKKRFGQRIKIVL